MHDLFFQKLGDTEPIFSGIHPRDQHAVPEPVLIQFIDRPVNLAAVRFINKLSLIRDDHTGLPAAVMRIPRRGNLKQLLIGLCQADRL